MSATAPITLPTQPLPIRTENDIVSVRHAVRTLAGELRFSLVDQTKMVTAASELARNTLIHGGGGEADLAVIVQGPRRGLRAIFRDRGPGIANVEEALRDGFTTGRGMGLGLGGARRLVNEFAIDSSPGSGTSVTIVKWK